MYCTLVRRHLPLAIHGAYATKCVCCEHGMEICLFDCPPGISTSVTVRVAEELRSDSEIAATLREWAGFVRSFPGMLDDESVPGELAISAINHALGAR